MRTFTEKELEQLYQQQEELFEKFFGDLMQKTENIEKENDKNK